MSNPDKDILPVGEENNSRRTITISVLAVIVIVASMLAIKTMQEAPNAGTGGPGGGSMSMPPAAVFVEPLLKETVQAEVFVTGVLRATSEASIAAREPGAVVEVLVDEGDTVKKNAIIARIDTRRITALLAEANATLASTKGLDGQRKAELARAQSDLEMKRGLLKSKAVSQSDVLDADRAMAVAKAQSGVAADGIAEAESRLSFLNIQLKDLTILAPFDGVIVDRRIEPGEWVAAGSIVASLVTVDPVEAWLRVPSRFLDNLSSDSRNFRVRRSSSGQVITPHKVEIIPQVEPLSQLFTVIATISNPNRKLVSGESITGVLPIGNLEPHWCFSTDALIRSESGDFVYVVVKPDKEGALPGSRKIPIEVAFERGNKAYVTVSSSGFTEGDQVIVEGNERLMPGQSLMVKVREVVSMPPTR
jgi:RND family efflux transporter MFP subunit